MLDGQRLDLLDHIGSQLHGDLGHAVRKVLRLKLGLWDPGGDLVQKAVENAERLGAGHSLVILLRKGYPINVLNQLKAVQEICRIYAATANPLQVLIFETHQGRGIAGVIDGFASKGIETEEDVVDRKVLLREVIGYKR